MHDNSWFWFFAEIKPRKALEEGFPVILFCFILGVSELKENQSPTVQQFSNDVVLNYINSKLRTRLITNLSFTAATVPNSSTMIRHTNHLYFISASTIALKSIYLVWPFPLHPLSLLTLLFSARFFSSSHFTVGQPLFICSFAIPYTFHLTYSHMFSWPTKWR